MLTYCKGNCQRQQLANYRYERYQESLKHNGNFYFGPKSLLLFGAASFLYELFPSNGEKGTADPTTMAYFFQKEVCTLPVDDCCFDSGFQSRRDLRYGLHLEWLY